MSSSIEEQFQPPEWATKEEVIKAAQHYINYWKIEARQRNQQWLDALQGESNAKRAESILRSELNVKHLTLEVLKSARERDVAEVHRLKAEVERLRKAGDEVVADLEHLTKSGWFDKCKSVKQWLAAKEGNAKS